MDFKTVPSLEGGERQVTYVWAVLVGMVGSCMSLFFEWMVEVIQWMLTGIWSDSRVGTFSLVEPEWRMFIPVAAAWWPAAFCCS